MASGAPHTLKWGIMATGWIAEGTLIPNHHVAAAAPAHA